MILKILIIGAAAILAGLFFGLPYYQAYKRREELARREQLEREKEKNTGQANSNPESPKK
jgi:hypothetical protein